MADITLKITDELCASVQTDIARAGYSIVRNVVAAENVDELRAYGFELLRQTGPEGVVWDPYIGEHDKVCYSEDHFQCMYRGYAFPWNVDVSRIDFKTVEELNALRLRLAKGLAADPNLEIADTYMTWSYYPAGKGWLDKHEDSVYSDAMLLHYIIPLTFKGEDFDSGGLYFTDRSGAVVDVDSHLKKGDVLFFDGACTHEVRQIGSSRDIGRMQAFAIPCAFKHPEQSDRFLGGLSMTRIARIKALNLLRALKRRLLA